MPFSIRQGEKSSLSPEMQNSILPSDTPVVFTAFEGEKPVGWILCFAFFTLREALLKGFEVIPDERNKGIGTALMKRLIEHLTSLEIQTLHFHYKAYGDDFLSIEKILNTTKWHPSQLLTRRYFFHPDSFKPNWFLSSKPKLPQEFSLFPFAEALPEEIIQAKSWVNDNPSLSSYSPFDTHIPMDPFTSLGLRYRGKLAGWMVNHRLNPKLLRYSAFYVIPEIRGSGPALVMLRESIRLHVQSGPDVEGCMEINFKLSPSSWIHFIKKRLAPFATRFEDTNYTWRSL